ncbi:MAG: hypothetical protein KJS68_08230 [Alphaproteobacteria bacterium]|nr:hypothetical protein [Alphaproteobacteria bacterium]
MRRFAVVLFVTVAVIACSRHSPPVGRWAGNYESNEVMVDARLEILPNGRVRVSAPDMFDIGSVSEDDRAAMHVRLASDLAEGWDQVSPRPMDFDGRVFRKPGGVAPQIEWNPNTHEMRLVFYFGTMRSIHIPMHAVNDFRSDPWAN